MSEHQPSALGQIYLPRDPGTPVGGFQFILDPDVGQGVEIGTPVAADTAEGTVIASVTDMRTVGTEISPTQADLGGGYDADPIAAPHEVQVASAQLLYSDRLRSVRSGRVRAATPAEMLTATGYDSIDWPIPAGVVTMADESLAPIFLDGTSLLGPEAAHLTIGGLSGQASKTSYAMTLLRSCVAAGSNKEHSVGAVIFNLKGEDLIWLDQEPNPDKALQEIDREIYKALGTPAKPFDNVRVYAPAMPGGKGTRSPREDARLLRWPMPLVWDSLKILLPFINEDEKLQSFFAQFRDELLQHPDPSRRIDSFRKLAEWFDEVLREEKDRDTGEVIKQPGWKSHHPLTLRRIRRMLDGLVARCGGLLTQEGPESERDIPVDGWEHGDVIVVDVAGLSNDVKGLVIGRTIERLMKSAEAGELGVDHLVCFVDELNEYAPALGNDMASVRRGLRRISSQGRYAGMSLWGAAQMLSKVDEQVRGNAMTMALGRTLPAELASGAYGRLPGGLAERIATLPKGHMAISHHTFRSMLTIRFPRPAWRTGSPKTSGAAGPAPSGRPRRPSTTEALGLPKSRVDRLTEGISPEVVENVLAQADDPQRAAKKLEELRVPDMRKEVLAPPPLDIDPTNPFGLDDDAGWDTDPDV